MTSETPYENYPARIVLLSNGLAIAIYALGAYILGRAGLVYALLYLGYCLWVEANVLRRSCVHCHYYGKVCGSGRGKLCSWLMRKGDPQRFVDRQVSWRMMVPDMMVPVFPLIGGIVLLIKAFTWPQVVLLVVLMALSLGGNAVIRGSFMCKYCRQREIGCPAQQLFAGKEK